MCDGSDRDCWLMECGCITCVGECVHGGCMVISITHHLSLSCVPVAQHSTTSPNTRPFVPCGVRKRDGTKRPGFYHETLHPFFADLSILRPRVKGRSFRHGGAVVMREALSRHLCFLHLLAGFAVRLTTTHPFVSIR